MFNFCLWLYLILHYSTSTVDDAGDVIMTFFISTIALMWQMTEILILYIDFKWSTFSTIFNCLLNSCILTLFHAVCRHTYHIHIHKIHFKKIFKVKYSPVTFQRVSIPPNPLFSTLILHGRISTTTNLSSPCPTLFLLAKFPQSPQLSLVSCSEYCPSVFLFIVFPPMYLACLPSSWRIGFQRICTASTISFLFFSNILTWN